MVVREHEVRADEEPGARSRSHASRYLDPAHLHEQLAKSRMPRAGVHERDGLQDGSLQASSSESHVNVTRYPGQAGLHRELPEHGIAGAGVAGSGNEAEHPAFGIGGLDELERNRLVTQLQADDIFQALFEHDVQELFKRIHAYERVAQRVTQSPRLLAAEGRHSGILGGMRVKGTRHWP